MSNKDSGVGPAQPKVWSKWGRKDLRRCCVVAQRLLQQQVQSMLGTGTSDVPEALDPMLLSARQRKRIRDAARLAQRLLQKQVDRMTLPMDVSQIATAAVTPLRAAQSKVWSKWGRRGLKRCCVVAQRLLQQQVQCMLGTGTSDVPEALNPMLLSARQRRRIRDSARLAQRLLLKQVDRMTLPVNVPHMAIAAVAPRVPEPTFSSKQTSLVSKGTSLVSERAPLVLLRASSTSERESSVSEEASSVLEEESLVSEEASSVSEEASSVSEEASSVSEGESSVSEEAFSVPEGESSVSEEASSVLEGESSMSERASSVSDQQSPIPKEMPEDFALILADNGHITYTTLQADANWSPPLPIQLEHIVQSHHLEIELLLSRLEAEVGVLNVADALVLARIMFANGTPITQRAYEYFRTELVGWIGYYQHHEMGTPIFHSIAHNEMHIYIVCENGFAFSCLARCVTEIENNPESAPFTLVRQPAISDALYCYKAIYMGIGRDAEYFCKQVQLHQPKLRADRWIVVGHEVCAEQQKTYFLFLMDEQSGLALAYRHNNNLFICMCTVKFTCIGRVSVAKIKTESVQSVCN